MKATTTLTARTITHSVLKATPTLAVRPITGSVMKVLYNEWRLTFFRQTNLPVFDQGIQCKTKKFRLWIVEKWAWERE